MKTVPIHFFLCLQCFSTIHYLRDIYTKLNYFSMFCTALISSHYSSNEADIKKFRIINIHSNHLFSTCFACFPRRSTCCKVSNIFTCWTFWNRCHDRVVQTRRKALLSRDANETLKIGKQKNYRYCGYCGRRAAFLLQARNVTDNCTGGREIVVYRTISNVVNGTFFFHLAFVRYYDSFSLTLFLSLSLSVRPISENRSVLTYNTNACLSNLFYLKSDYINDRKKSGRYSVAQR